MANGKTINRKLTGSYLALIRRFPLRPIMSGAELDQATALVNELLDRDRLDAAEDDYLDVLSDLVERYENLHHPIPTDDLSDGEMLEHLIEAKGVDQAEAARGAQGGRRHRDQGRGPGGDGQRQRVAGRRAACPGRGIRPGCPAGSARRASRSPASLVRGAPAHGRHAMA